MAAGEGGGAVRALGSHRLVSGRLAHASERNDTPVLQGLAGGAADRELPRRAVSQPSHGGPCATRRGSLRRFVQMAASDATTDGNAHSPATSQPHSVAVEIVDEREIASWPSLRTSLASGTTAAGLWTVTPWRSRRTPTRRGAPTSQRSL